MKPNSFRLSFTSTALHLPGGPLLVDGFQAGIVSWGTLPCGNPTAPQVYTATSAFINWIEEKTNLGFI